MTICLMYGLLGAALLYYFAWLFRSSNYLGDRVLCWMYGVGATAGLLAMAILCLFWRGR